VREQQRRPQQEAVDEETLQQEKETLEAEVKEAEQRDGVMQKVQGIWLKLAELYGTEHVRDAEKMENALIQAVTVSRTEVQRRKDLNLPISTHEGKGFINLTHVATAYNELADFYVNKGRSQLATTLYMQALDLIKQEQEPGSATCAQVVLLNNISSQMAQQAQMPLAPRPDSSGPPLSRDQLLHAASEWAKKALDVAAHIKPSIRDAECDQGCQVATYNLGEIAEMRENYSEAEKHYESARKLAVELQFEEGVQRADEALNRLKARN
jgi:tetratricopeptide (TPR) repeat protein